jgi:hypothetical protein
MQDAVGGEQLVAPPVSFLQPAQLRPGRGPFATAEDPHVGRPVRHGVPAVGGAQQPGQLHHPRVVEVAGLAVAVEHVLPLRFRQSGDGGPIVCASFHSQF